MRKLILVPLFILFFTIGAWAQPVNKTYELVADTLSYSGSVLESDVQDNQTSLPENVCLYEVLNGETRYYYLSNVAPGPHLYRVRVLYDDVTISGTFHPSNWTGWSNTITGTKPEILDLSIADGFLVTTPQSGIVSTKVYIRVGGAETEYIGLNEFSPDGQWLRIYDIRAFSPGVYDVWANAAIPDSNGSPWEGDWQVNPFAVTVGPALMAPANLRLR